MSSITKLADNKFLASNLQIAYPDLYVARSFKNDAKNTPRFGLTLLLPKSDTEGHKLISDAIKAIAKAELKMDRIPATDVFLRDGDESNNEAYHGHWYMSLYKYPNDKQPNNGAPQVVDANKKAIKATDSNAPYSGCFCDVVFEAYAGTKWKKVNGGLSVVRFRGDGEPIGGGSDVNALPDLEPAGLSDEDM